MDPLWLRQSKVPKLIDKYANFGRTSWQQCFVVLVDSNLCGSFEGARLHWQMITILSFDSAEVETIIEWKFCWQNHEIPNLGFSSHYPDAQSLFCSHSFECLSYYSPIRKLCHIMSSNDVIIRSRAWCCPLPLSVSILPPSRAQSM